MMASQDQDQQQSGTRSRGFGSMDPVRQREIAAEGGRAAHQKGTAHEFSSEEARRAGSKGGTAAHQRGTAHQFTSEEAREAGRAGGQASRNRRNQRNEQVDDDEME
jgi:general stress protein YciG